MNLIVVTMTINENFLRNSKTPRFTSIVDLSEDEKT